jgi:hypothetical protein
MELLKALAMPFKGASLLFVAMSALLLGLVTTVMGSAGIVVIAPALIAILLLMVWLTQFAFAMIDDAANGASEPAPASAEMISVFGDPRCWIHPFIAVVVGVALFMQPSVPVLPVLATAALFYPPSLAAIAMSGHALDALNPFALARMVRGLGWYYPLAVVWVTLCVATGLLVASSGLWAVLRIAALELLLLVVYAFIGGALYTRRTELGFEPRINPDKADQREQDDRLAERQRMIDRLYSDLRTRDYARAVTGARQWLEKTDPHLLAGDVRAILEAGTRWPEPRNLARLLQGLVPPLLALRQPAAAFAAVEAAVVATPDFALAQEPEAVAMIRFAMQTGRNRLAATLLTNFIGTGQRQLGPELQELRTRLLT